MRRHDFAPGVIEHHKRSGLLGTAAQRAELKRVLRGYAIWMLCSFAIGLIGGLGSGLLTLIKGTVQ